MHANQIRRIVSEEINFATPLTAVLTREEIRSLRILESRTRTINEGIDWMVLKDLAIIALKTRVGRRILISLFKTARFLFDLASMPITKISIPMWRKIFEFIESKGVKLPFDPEEVFDFVKYYMPSNLASMGITALIELLDGMTDAEYLEMIGEKEKETKKDPDGKEKDRKSLPDKEASPKPDDEDRVEREPDDLRAVAERRIRVIRGR